jgi:hypothetical protein
MKSVLFILMLVVVIGCVEDQEPAAQPECAMSATVDNKELCYEGSRYLIAYASVPGEPSVFSLSTPHIINEDKSYYQISVETTEFAGPGEYILRKYDGGSERSTYGYFFNVNTKTKEIKEYSSVSGSLIVESVTRIEGTSNGNANGSFTMAAEDEHGNEVYIEGSFNSLLGMGWWEK